MKGEGEMEIGLLGMPIEDAAKEDWQDKASWYLRHIGVPRIFCNQQWEDFRKSKGKARALEAAQAWCRRRSSQRGGLIVHGPVGTGKSLLAALCVRDVLINGTLLDERRWRPRYWEILRDGYEETWDPGILWTTMSDLLRRVRYQCFDTEESSEDVEVERLRNIPLLVLDDIGVRALTEWGHDFLLSVVDARWAAGRPILATSNLDPAGLSSVLEERICSRLRGSCELVSVGGQDMRTVHGGRSDG